MKRIFILHLFFTHCILINASEKPSGIIPQMKGCFSQIAETSQHFFADIQLLREKSPEIKKICNCGALTCACASCYYCPQCCCCSASCALLTAASFIAYQDHVVTTQPKRDITQHKAE